MTVVVWYFATPVGHKTNFCSTGRERNRGPRKTPKSLKRPPKNESGRQTLARILPKENEAGSVG